MTAKDINNQGLPATDQQIKNMEALSAMITSLEKAFGGVFIVTSGLRDMETQNRVNPRNKGSAHLEGSAVDIADADGAIWNFITDNLDLAEELGLYFEAKAYTPNWVHIQSRPPRSGKRIFIP